jgi:hypothetical protein
MASVVILKKMYFVTMFQVNSHMELPGISVSNDEHLVSLSSDIDDSPDHKITMSMPSPPTQYIVMETPGDEMHICLPDGTTGMIMDEELVAELKTESTDLGVAMETEDGEVFGFDDNFLKILRLFCNLTL